MTSRRRFLANSALGVAGLTLARVGFAADPDIRRRLVLVILRGGLDGLAAFPPYGDDQLHRQRESLVQQRMLQLDGTFGIHPGMRFLAERFRAGEAVVLHAVSTPYRDRSHFDAQNVLESGGERPYQLHGGWLNRIIKAGSRHSGIALDHTVPLVLRGGAPVATWAPDQPERAGADFLDRVASMYANDNFLALQLQAARSMAEPNVKGGPGSRPLFEAAGRFLAPDGGPNVAVLELGGWDTHSDQVSRLNRLLADLDQGLARLHRTLGKVWPDSAVLVVTEFGRTVSPNGSGGTDHGIASAAWLVGGAVRGGRVIADWPGLGRSNLYQGRDLTPTRDLRSVYKAVARDLLGVPESLLATRIYPGSGTVSPIAGLFR